MGETTNILEMARGAILERADYETQKIIANIIDPNTSATKKRTLTITVEFEPDDDRNFIQVSAVSKSKLEPTNAVKTSLFLTDDANGDFIAVEMTPQIPGQRFIDGGEQEREKYFKAGAR